MATQKFVKLDVREMAPWERHPKIFEVFDGLKVGETLELVNDHNPAPLHYQFMFERKGMFNWKVEEVDIHEWVAQITKIADKPVEELEEAAPGKAVSSER